MKKQIAKEVKQENVLFLEIFSWITGVVFIIFSLKSLLIYGETTLIHDNLYWEYPIFQFFAENIAQGNYPFWNPYSHGGEPFYPITLQLRLLDPNTLLTIFLGKIFTQDITIIFNWNRLVQTLIMSLGVYLFFRSLTRHLFVRLSLIPILLFSSFMLVSLHQHAMIFFFMWIPYIAYYLFAIVCDKDYRWRNWIILAALVGLNWQSYIFAGVWIFILFFFLSILFFKKELLKNFVKSRGVFLKLTVFSVIAITMMLPNIVSFLEKERFVYPARMIEADYESKNPQGGPQQHEGSVLTDDNSIVMPYNLITHTGTFSTIWDFIKIISPEGNILTGADNKKKWGKTSEAYMYIGLLPFAIALLGFAAGKHDLKFVFFFLLCAFGVLMLGPQGWIHRPLYYVYPPLWFVRHTHSFVLFFLFFVLYFYVLGANYIFSPWKEPLFLFNPSQGGITKRVIGRVSKSQHIHRPIAIIIFSIITFCSSYFVIKLEYPETNYTLSFIAAVFFAGWFLNEDLGKGGMFVSLIISHFVLVLILQTFPYHFFLKVVLFIGVPFAFLIFVKRDEGIAKRFYLVPLLGVILTISILVDLGSHLKDMAFLYGGQKSPEKALGLDLGFKDPEFPNMRDSVPAPYYSTGTFRQSIRYLSLLYHQSCVFSPIYETLTDTEWLKYFTFEDENISEVVRNGSFEEWEAEQGGLTVPVGYTYFQDGEGGGVKKYELKDEVKDSLYSMSLSPSSKGNSFVRFLTNEVEHLKGKTIAVSVWVKSQNRIPGAVQVDLQDGVSPVTLRSYSNSGVWKHLIMVKKIDKNAQWISLTCNVKAQSSAEAWFDGVKTYILDGDEFEFVNALYSKRWNSFLLSKRYFKIIHTKIPPFAMMNMFAVGSDVFQFKKGLLHIDEDLLPDFLNQLGSKKAAQLLDDYSFVSGRITEPFASFSHPAEEYNQIVSDQEAKSGFTYRSKRYSYNKFEVEVSSNEEGILYWSDGYDKWWRAFVEGNEVPICCANMNFKALVIPKGKSNLSFVYDPPLFKKSLIAFYGMLFISLAWVLVSWIFSRYRLS